MKEYSYTITFHSDWLCSSGLSSGSDTDAIPIIDAASRLPYIPGKTIKGLIRDNLNRYFHTAYSDNNPLDIYVSNATIADLIDSVHIPFLFRNIASTRITELGVAMDNSLRSKTVVIPLTLSGKMNIQDALFDQIKKACGLIKELGTNRNRGLGKCTITINPIN